MQQNRQRWLLIVQVGVVVSLMLAAVRMPLRTAPRLEAATVAAKKRVLFVCVENANRSQMAEAFARHHGGPNVDAFSSGSKPSGKVNPRAIQFMAERGIDLSKHTSKPLTALPAGPFDAVVTMGCGDACPNLAAKRRIDWAIPDPKHLPDDEFRRVRDLIEDKVKALLAEL
jgi:protein-tyrosine-phosphatase